MGVKEPSEPEPEQSRVPDLSSIVPGITPEQQAQIMLALVAKDTHLKRENQNEDEHLPPRKRTTHSKNKPKTKTIIEILDSDGDEKEILKIEDQ